MHGGRATQRPQDQSFILLWKTRLQGSKQEHSMLFYHGINNNDDSCVINRYHKYTPNEIFYLQKLTMKYILVTGGVISGIGKGVIASSIGTILKHCGLRVTSIKIDPYINIDAGTFSPYEHGKCWMI